jgi:hypothetical protein
MYRIEKSVKLGTGERAESQKTKFMRKEDREEGG